MACTRAQPLLSLLPGRDALVGSSRAAVRVRYRLPALDHNIGCYRLQFRNWASSQAAFFSAPTAPLQIAACNRSEHDRKHKSTSQEQKSFQVNDLIGIQVSSKQQPISNSLVKIDEPSCRSYGSPSDASGQPELILPEKQQSTCSFKIPVSNPNPLLINHVDRGSSQVHVAQRRRFKLTFLMLIRFALVNMAADVMGRVVLMVAGFDEKAIILCYSLYLNCVGDALLYRFLNPRYREPRREIALAATRRLSQLKLRLNQRLMRYLSFIIEFI